MSPSNYNSSDFNAGEFDRLFCRTYERLVNWCRRAVWGGLGDAEDFVHDAYLRSRRRWIASQQSRDHAEAFLFRSLRWVIADAIRRRPAQASMEGVAPASVSNPQREVLARDSLHSALSAVEGELCRGLMIGRTKQQLCQDFTISPGALAVRLTRARQKLERYLDSSRVRRLQSRSAPLNCKPVRGAAPDR
jgi:DNA-directed RNA polymerase specialized sigma24 family protein